MNYAQFLYRFNLKLESRLHNPKKWVDELVSVLCLSKNAIYKRHSGDSPYTWEEILRLAAHYKFSIDELLFEQTDQVKFHMPHLIQPVRSIEDYLSKLRDQLKQLEFIGTAQIYYATRELPVFYYFLYKELTAFKMFGFAQTAWNLPGLCEQIFDLKFFSPELFSIANDCWNEYASLYSIEFWNPGILDNTLYQLLYYCQLKKIQSDQAIALLSNLVLLIKRISQMAANQRKSEKISSQSLTMYLNRTLHTNNLIFVESEKLKILYLTYDNPNFIFTTDDKVVNYTSNWFKVLEKNAYLLAGSNNAYRDELFEALIQKIEMMSERIQWMDKKGNWTF